MSVAVLFTDVKWLVMPDAKVQQLQYESDSWKRLLSFITDENVYLKYRLSGILKNITDNSLLDELEKYNDRFISEDDLLRLMRNEVAEIDKLLLREIFEDGKIVNDIERKIKKVRENITVTEKQFSQLRRSFDNFLRENIVDADLREFNIASI